MNNKVLQLQPKSQLQKLHIPFAGEKKFIVSSSNCHEIISNNDVVYISSDSNYSHIYFLNRKPILCSKTLKLFATFLEPLGFWRIHQKYLVNPDFLLRLAYSDGMYAEMKCGAKLNVSRAKRKQTMQKLFEKFTLVDS